MDTVQVLKLTLHGSLVGYLAGFQSGRNILVFDESFAADPNRPTFSLTTHPEFPRATQMLTEPWVKTRRLHPVLSNLLPEGAFREWVAQGLKTHVDNEFRLFSYLGRDLPGALVATPVAPDDVPAYMFGAHGKAQLVPFEQFGAATKFSLAGIQMKFSMREQGGRYDLLPSECGDDGHWIVKTPSTLHPEVPANEFSAMSLAALAGVQVPPIRLVGLGDLDNLPAISLPKENLAYAIRRFDRADNARIHTEDFAQVLAKYPHEKYQSGNYEQLAKVLYRYSGDGLADVQQFARGLLVNILLANGDAHLKNWSLIYSDGRTPRLSPAYDIVTTSVYIMDERHYALNLDRNKDWYKASLEHFERWAKRADIPWRAIRPHLLDVIDKARSTWPGAIEQLPMADAHKAQLKIHWKKLQPEFQIQRDR